MKITNVIVADQDHRLESYYDNVEGFHTSILMAAVARVIGMDANVAAETVVVLDTVLYEEQNPESGPQDLIALIAQFPRELRVYLLIDDQGMPKDTEGYRRRKALYDSRGKVHCQVWQSNRHIFPGYFQEIVREFNRPVLPAGIRTEEGSRALCA